MIKTKKYIIESKNITLCDINVERLCGIYELLSLDIIIPTPARSIPIYLFFFN